jgi:proteic killer suppression protein
MIKSFGDRETEKIWNGVYSKKLPGNIQPVARRKLRMINNAKDLKVPQTRISEIVKRNASEK